jgi:hypothetical protein
MFFGQTMGFAGNFDQFCVGKAYANYYPMKKICSHVERKSRFLQALMPINPCEEIRFGIVDCLAISLSLACFASLVCVLAK